MIGPLGGFFLVGFGVVISFSTWTSEPLFNGGPAMESHSKTVPSPTTFLVGLGPVTKPRPLAPWREQNKMETLVCLLKVGQGQVWSWETKLFFHIYFLLKRKSKVFVLTRLPSSHWSSTYMAQCSIITQRKMNEITWEIVKLLGWNLLRCIFFEFIIFRLFFNVWLILAPH